MTNLDRLLELGIILQNPDRNTWEYKKDLEEYVSLKAKIEGKIEKQDMLFNHRGKIKNLESQVEQIQRDYSHLLRQKKDCEIGNHNLRGQIAKLQEENEHNKFMKKKWEELGCKTALEYHKQLEQYKSVIDEIEKKLPKYGCRRDNYWKCECCKDLEKFKSILDKLESKE